jgi:hypothetical protein
MSDSKRLAATLVGAYAFYDKELTDFQARMWREALSGIDADTIDAAFSRHLRDTRAGKFCPKPADILLQIHGDADDAALIAWGEVISAARSGGGKFDGPTQEAIDSMGGMGRLRMAGEHENGFLQRQFLASFKAYRARSEAPPWLQGVEVQRIGNAS